MSTYPFTDWTGVRARSFKIIRNHPHGPVFPFRHTDRPAIRTVVDRGQGDVSAAAGDTVHANDISESGDTTVVAQDPRTGR